MFIQKTHPTYGSTSQTKDGVIAGQYYDNKYGTNLLNTGKTLGVCSIYDLGGNLWEYTTESFASGSITCVSRGGYYSYSAGGYPAGTRNSTIDNAHDAGFRITLFVK